MLASSSPCQGCQVSATEREQRNYGASNRAVYSWSKRSVVNTKARLFKNRRALVSAASTEAPSTGLRQPSSKESVARKAMLEVYSGKCQ